MNPIKILAIGNPMPANIVEIANKMFNNPKTETYLVQVKGPAHIGIPVYEERTRSLGIERDLHLYCADTSEKLQSMIDPEAKHNFGYDHLLLLGKEFPKELSDTMIKLKIINPESEQKLKSSPMRTTPVKR